METTKKQFAPHVAEAREECPDAELVKLLEDFERNIETVSDIMKEMAPNDAEVEAK